MTRQFAERCRSIFTKPRGLFSTPSEGSHASGTGAAVPTKPTPLSAIQSKVTPIKVKTISVDIKRNNERPRFLPRKTFSAGRLRAALRKLVAVPCCAAPRPSSVGPESEEQVSLTPEYSSFDEDRSEGGGRVVSAGEMSVATSTGVAADTVGGDDSIEHKGDDIDDDNVADSANIKDEDTDNEGRRDATTADEAPIRVDDQPATPVEAALGALSSSFIFEMNPFNEPTDDEFLELIKQSQEDLSSYNFVRCELDPSTPSFGVAPDNGLILP